jgi:hypothetical protein
MHDGFGRFLGTGVLAPVTGLLLPSFPAGQSCPAKKTGTADKADQFEAIQQIGQHR